MQTVRPNLIVQQQSNTLAMRPLVTRAVDEVELHTTYFGSADDDEMTPGRLRQANLIGPAGLVSIDDDEIMRHAQRGARAGHECDAVEMRGGNLDDAEHIVTEVAIRAFHDRYRRVMAL